MIFIKRVFQRRDFYYHATALRGYLFFVFFFEAKILLKLHSLITAFIHCSVRSIKALVNIRS